VDGDVLYSNEGTIQGDPLAMPFYVLATISLCEGCPKWLYKLSLLIMLVPVGNFLIYDCGGTRSLSWGLMQFGFFPYAGKLGLFKGQPACLMFSDTCVNVTSDGRPYLGAAIGPQSYVADYESFFLGGVCWKFGSVCSFLATCCLCCIFSRSLVNGFSSLETFLM